MPNAGSDAGWFYGPFLRTRRRARRSTSAATSSDKCSSARSALISASTLLGGAARLTARSAAAALTSAAAIAQTRSADRLLPLDWRSKIAHPELIPCSIDQRTAPEGVPDSRTCLMYANGYSRRAFSGCARSVQESWLRLLRANLSAGRVLCANQALQPRSNTRKRTQRRRRSGGRQRRIGGGESANLPREALGRRRNQAPPGEGGGASEKPGGGCCLLANPELLGRG